MKIQAVKGISDSLNLNIVDAHVHIYEKKEEHQNSCSLSEAKIPAMINSCIEDFKENGGSFVIDCTPHDCGRDGNILYEISNKTGVEVVCVTGFHRREYYFLNSKIWALNIEDASSFL